MFQNPEFFGHKKFLAKILQKKFGTQSSFGTNILLDPKYFWPKILLTKFFLTPKFFLNKRFHDPQFFLPKIFLTKFFF